MNICTACGENFGGVTGFDMHQTQRGDKVTCAVPANGVIDCGKRGQLIKGKNDKWIIETDRATFSFTDSTEKREFYPTPCKVCNKPIKSTGKPGRPPTKHKECK